MYREHSEIITPDRKQTIWRYMSLDKFLSLLNDKQLYFARHDKFNDLKEAMRSDLDLKLYDKYVEGISETIKNDPFGCGFINCWIIENFDLYLMWRSYSSLDKGIAIKSSIGNLIDSLDSKDKRSIFISDVEYMDYITGFTFDKYGGSENDLARFFCKRENFKQEKELRAVYYDYEMRLDSKKAPDGLKFKVSLNTLIDEIWIAPNATKEFEKNIKEIVRKHGITKPIRRSQI